MKTKPISLILSIILAVSLLPRLDLTVQAEEPAVQEETPSRVLHINTVDRFLHFSEQCRLDSYSQNLTVYLDCDLDLSETDFRGIPIFCGTLEGNKHRITGFHLTAGGSNQGFFRFLTEDAHIRDLTVEGTLAPTGSQANIGGIAGVNQGSLEGCRFKGSIAGGDVIGGLVGSNRVTGTITGCQAICDISGNHFTGGIAGENYGVIKNCISRSSVNTTARETQVNVTSISMDTITGTESAGTVTDIGGIAGTNTGVIRDCVNRGPVGYRHIGYNVGGIAGSHTGLIIHCQNYGKIYGRKETGGIVGQFEPVTQIEYTIDTLQILEKQLSAASGSLSQAAYNAQTNLGEVGQSIQDMRDYTDTARDSLHSMVDGEITDLDSYIAAKNALGQSLHSMHTTMEDIGQSAELTVGQLNQDLKNVSAQIGAMSQTIRDANENMGIRLADVSDQDTEDNFTGKIADCENFNSVSGDINTGGIAGSVSFENDLDPEDDLKVYGDRSLNFEGSVRAVILNCINRGTVTVKKMGAGGIAGQMNLGLVKNCINTGIVDGEKAQFVGGIAGISRGYIRSSHVKCGLKGESNVGGIAGSGTIVTNCRSMVTIRQATEKTGAILGTEEPSQDEEVTAPIAGNIYMSLSQDLGAIDGISYQGRAEPMPPEKFRQQPDLPEAFLKTTLTFETEENVRTRLVIPTGSVLQAADIPPVPGKEGCDGQWQDIDHYLGARIYFDSTLQPVYTPHRITIRSPQQRSSGRPVMLAEGVFPDIAEIQLKPLQSPALDGGEVLEAWQLPRLSRNQPVRLHLALPENADAALLRLLVEKEDGCWQEVSHEVNARYLIFDAEPEDRAVCVQQLPDCSRVRYVLWAAGAGALLLLLRYLRHRSKKKGN